MIEASYQSNFEHDFSNGWHPTLLIELAMSVICLSARSPSKNATHPT
jgi:hypothetical protein